MMGDVAFTSIYDVEALAQGLKADPLKDNYIDEENYILDAKFNSSIYHETLSMQQCGRHTVNCLLQKPLYTWKDFENEAKLLQKETKAVLKSRFSFFNPHKNLLGLGNYDIQLMERLMLKHDIQFRWIRQNCENIEYEIFEKNKYDRFGNIAENVIGLIINLPVETLFPNNNSKTHFLPLRKVDNNWYNLDSRLPGPQLFIDFDHMIQWIIRIQGIYGSNKLTIISVYENVTYLK